jgi:acyl carrier protein
MDLRDVLAEVQSEIRVIRAGAGLRDCEIADWMSLIDDLDMDSILFIDLSLALERRFLIPDFPLQGWADAEALRIGRRYSVGSLAEYVHGLLVGDSRSSAVP